MSIFQRIKETAFMPNARLLPHVHVLDLNKNGYGLLCGLKNCLTLLFLCTCNNKEIAGFVSFYIK